MQVKQTIFTKTTVFLKKEHRLFLPFCQSMAVIACQNRFGTVFDCYRMSALELVRKGYRTAKAYRTPQAAIGDRQRK